MQATCPRTKQLHYFTIAAFYQNFLSKLLRSILFIPLGKEGGLCQKRTLHSREL